MPDDKKNSDFNIFIANSIYPEAENILIAKYKSLSEIKDDCFVIIDTNSLLVPYTINQKSLDQIEKTYSLLANEKRLIIPGQVAREFAKNRANKLSELFDQLSRKRNSNNQIGTGNYPLLESLPEYKKAIKLEKEINKLIVEYGKALGVVLNHIHNWTWNDPVSVLYGNLFKGVVLDTPINEEIIKNELLDRYTHKIPPGYKDGSKADEGIGDYLIWKTILEVGKLHKKSVLFVSGEEKPDWWHRSNGQSLYPRFELIDEFRRFSDGQTFHIVKFSSFLDLYGASDDVVEEVRNKEMYIAETPVKFYGGGFVGSPNFELIKEAVIRWLRLQFPEADINILGGMSRKLDIQIKHKNQTYTNVLIKFSRNLIHITRRIREAIDILAEVSDVEEASGKEFTKPLIILVVDNHSMIVDDLKSIEVAGSQHPNISINLGYLDIKGDFILVKTFNHF